MENLKCVAEHNVSAFKAIEPTTEYKKGEKTTEKLSRTLNIWLRIFYDDIASRIFRYISYITQNHRARAFLPDFVFSSSLSLRSSISCSFKIKTIQIYIYKKKQQSLPRHTTAVQWIGCFAPHIHKAHCLWILSFIHKYTHILSVCVCVSE